MKNLKEEDYKSTTVMQFWPFTTSLCHWSRKSSNLVTYFSPSWELPHLTWVPSPLHEGGVGGELLPWNTPICNCLQVNNEPRTKDLAKKKKWTSCVLFWEVLYGSLQGSLWKHGCCLNINGVYKKKTLLLVFFTLNFYKSLSKVVFNSNFSCYYLELHPFSFN